jgi:hypothetical protein
MALIFPGSLPSLIFGTHSIICSVISKIFTNLSLAYIKPTGLFQSNRISRILPLHPEEIINYR